MANPQKENGYTPIANELFEKIYSAPFNATQLKIIMVICRFTYGFSRKEHPISESFISKAVNISKRYITSELNKLIEQNVIKIIKPHTDVIPRILALNKHYNEWEIEGRAKEQQVNNTSTGEQYINSTDEQSFDPTGEQYITQDKQNIKQNIKQISSEDKIKKPKYSDSAKELSMELKQRLTDLGVKTFTRDWHLKNYSVIDKLLKIVTKEEILGCMDWCFNDSYWKNKIDSFYTIERLFTKYQLSKSKESQSRESMIQEIVNSIKSQEDEKC